MNGVTKLTGDSEGESWLKEGENVDQREDVWIYKYQ